MGLNVNSEGDLVRHNRNSLVGILDGDRKIHLIHNRIMSQQIVMARDERIRIYALATSSSLGTPIIMIVSDVYPIVDSIGTILSKHF